MTYTASGFIVIINYITGGGLPAPPVDDFRITDASDIRITDGSNNRIID